MSIDSVVLNEEQQLELSRIAQSRSLPAGYVFRARLILMLSEGASFSAIKQRLGTTAPTIIRWKHRFLAAVGRTGYQPSRTAVLGVDPEAASPDSVGYAQGSRGTVPLTGVAASLPRRWESARMQYIASGKRRD
jgi:hypothetical protein